MTLDLAVIGAAIVILAVFAAPVLAWDIRDRWQRAGEALEQLAPAPEDDLMAVADAVDDFGTWDKELRHVTGYVTRVCCCPECGSDLDDEGFEFWCPSCQQPYPFNAVILPGDVDDDPERGLDD